MALVGNKGEWSELYALLKLLGEGKVYAGNQALHTIVELCYPIVAVLRQEKFNKYTYRRLNNVVSVQSADGEELLRCPASQLLMQAEMLLASIRQGKGTFGVEDIEAFVKTLYIESLKAHTTDKTDIRLVLHDVRTHFDVEMGFSIKSQLGGDATLLNAGKATNFCYCIEGYSFSDAEVTAINGIDTPRKVVDRIRAIQVKGAQLSFHHVENATFYNNLRMLDGDLPQVMSHLLLAQIAIDTPLLKPLCEYLTRTNPLGYAVSDKHPFYAYKVKHLLTATALGLMPATPWQGIYDANGGYLVVRKDGEIVCYHFYDRNRFEDYLFANAYLERASTTRHGYGVLERGDDGHLYFKINLQIRLH